MCDKINTGKSKFSDGMDLVTLFMTKPLNVREMNLKRILITGLNHPAHCLKLTNITQEFQHAIENLMENCNSLDINPERVNHGSIFVSPWKIQETNIGNFSQNRRLNIILEEYEHARGDMMSLFETMNIRGIIFIFLYFYIFIIFTLYCKQITENTFGKSDTEIFAMGPTVTQYFGVNSDLKKRTTEELSKHLSMILLLKKL